MTLYDVSILVTVRSRDRDMARATEEKFITVEADTPSDAAKCVLARFGELAALVAP